MERRELRSLGGIAAIAGAFASVPEAPAQEDAPAQEGAQAGGKRLLCVYTDPIATRPRRINMAQMVSLTGMTCAEYKKSETEDWHRSPVRQYSISLSGEIDVEVSGGKKHAIHAGDIVFP